jgi:hypothetical protein
MTTLREAAQQALDALYDIDATGVPVGHIDLVIDTLKAALAQQEQDWEDLYRKEKARADMWRDKYESIAGPDERVYTQQEQATVKESLPVDPEGGWQSAPSPQVTQRIADMPMSEYRRGVNDGFKLGLREGRIKAEDEMREQQEQEPVACFIGIKGSAYDLPTTKRAYTYADQPGNVDASKLGRAIETAKHCSAGDSIDAGLVLLKALQAEGFGVFQLGAEYTHPPRREWRRLTDEEIWQLYVKWDATPEASMAEFARAVEQALKERNT